MQLKRSRKSVCEREGRFLGCDGHLRVEFQVLLRQSVVSLADYGTLT